mgnify:CR=1 FL=1
MLSETDLEEQLESLEEDLKFLPGDFDEREVAIGDIIGEIEEILVINEDNPNLTEDLESEFRHLIKSAEEKF